jgi:16S rRNA (uracil1498-N3)-methyltransferase
MHRFYLPPPGCQGPELLLPEAESHHAMDVLRLRRGDVVMVLDGVGGEFGGEVVDAARRGVKVRVRSSRQHPPPRSQVVLVQSVLKGKAMEVVLQKAVELGATRLVPLLSEHTVPHLEARAEDKRARWQFTVQQALKQSGNPWLPVVDVPADLPTCLQMLKSTDLSLMADLAEGSKHPRFWFDEWRQTHQRVPESIALWIGPEGDFTAEERESMLAHWIRPITLGPWVLRSETAAFYCLSVVSYELQFPASV